MIVCDSPDFMSWRPDLSLSGQRGATWTRLMCGDVTLCNSLEWVDWHEDPVQVRICEGCGFPGCERGGYVRITRLGSHLLWTRPRVDIGDEWERVEFELLRALCEEGAVLIATRTWDAWRTRFPDLPESASFAPTSRWDLAQAWLMDAPLVPRVTPEPGWLHAPFVRRRPRTVRRRPATFQEAEAALPGALVAAQDLSTEQGRAAIERLIGWFKSDPEVPVAGELIEAVEVKADVLKLHFDLGHVQLWRAIARRDGNLSPVLGGAWLLVPEPVASNS